MEGAFIGVYRMQTPILYHLVNPINNTWYEVFNLTQSRDMRIYAIKFQVLNGVNVGMRRTIDGIALGVANAPSGAWNWSVSMEGHVSLVPDPRAFSYDCRSILVEARAWGGPPNATDLYCNVWYGLRVET